MERLLCLAGALACLTVLFRAIPVVADGGGGPDVLLLVVALVLSVYFLFRSWLPDDG